MKKGVNLIKETKKIIIAADKSNYYYSCDLETFKTLRSKNVETDYKKSNEKAAQLVDKKSCEFAESMKLEEKAQKHTKSECFLTHKDHKENSTIDPEFRVINTAKNELGKVVKIKIDEINREIRYTLGVNQWQSTKNTLDWFRKIQNPNSYTFIQFDIEKSYPSIDSKLLKDTINFANSVNGIIISEKLEELIFHCRKSFSSVVNIFKNSIRTGQFLSSELNNFLSIHSII